MPDLETLLLDRADRIATITLNRPDRMNAFNAQMRADLVAAFDITDADDAVRAVIVTGAGRAFCAGADLANAAKTFDYASRADALREAARVRTPDGDVYRDGGGLTTLRIFRSVKPVIAAVNGAAVGIGATMLLPMDIRLAADTAAHRLRLRPSRDRPRSGVFVVPDARRRHADSARTVLHRPADRCRRGSRSRLDPVTARTGHAAGRRARHRSRDRGPCGARFGRARRARCSGAVRGRRSDDGAPHRQSRHAGARRFGRCPRGRRLVPAEAASPLSRPGLDRDARLLPVVAGPSVRMTPRHRRRPSPHGTKCPGAWVECWVERLGGALWVERFG